MSTTLHYFGGYGRAEATRMILHSQGVAFTDANFDGEGFQAFLQTGKSEFGQVPCLEIDGKSLVESRAIERYLLAKAGVHTATPYEGYLNDSTLSFLDDVRGIIAKFVYVDQDMEGLMKWFASDLPYYLRLLNARVNEHHLFTGSSAQHADWAVFEFVWDGFLRAGKVAMGRPALEAHAPKLIAFAENFKNSNQNLSNYLNARPEKDM